MEQEQPGALAGRERLAVDGDLVVVGDVERGAGQNRAIDGDAALLDPQLGVAARAQAGARHDLGDALAFIGASGGRGLFARLRGRFAGAAGLRAGPGFLGVSFSIAV